MPLYVKFAKEKRPRTVKLFLIEYYSIRKDPYLAYGEQTYSNSDCTVRHCNRSYRSFDDLLDLVNTYYPSIKPKKLMHYLLTVKIKLPDNREGFYWPHLATCSGMGRIRYIPYYQKWYNQDQINLRMGNSRYTWKELLSMLGITNEKEFFEYIEINRQP